VVTGAGKDVVEEDRGREEIEELLLLDVVEKELDDSRVEVESVREREEEVRVGLEVVNLELSVEERPVVSDELSGVEESELPEDVGMRVNESERPVGIDEGNEVEGSIVTEGSENVLEMNKLLSKLHGRTGGVEVSVRVGVGDVGTPEKGGSVSNVPVLDGNTAVIVGSLVSVGVGGRVTSESVEGSGVDTGKPVGVPDRNVGSVSSSWLENGGIMPVKLKGGRVRKTVSNSVSSSLIEGVDKPRRLGVGDGRWALRLVRSSSTKRRSSSVQPPCKVG